MIPLAILGALILCEVRTTTAPANLGDIIGSVPSVPDIQPGTKSVIARKSKFGKLQNQREIKAQMDYTTTLLARLQTYTMLAPPVLPKHCKDGEVPITVKSTLEVKKQRCTYGWYIRDFNRPKVMGQGGDEISVKTTNENSVEIFGQYRVSTERTRTVKRKISTEFYVYRQYEAQLTVRVDVFINGQWRYHSYEFLPVVEDVEFAVTKSGRKAVVAPDVLRKPGEPPAS